MRFDVDGEFGASWNEQFKRFKRVFPVLFFDGVMAATFMLVAFGVHRLAHALFGEQKWGPLTSTELLGYSHLGIFCTLFWFGMGHLIKALRADVKEAQVAVPANQEGVA